MVFSTAFRGQPEKRLARLAGLSLDELWTLFDRLDLLGS